MKITKVRVKNIAVAVSILSIVAVASTMAFFTSSDTVTNKFQVAHLDIELIESEFDNLLKTTGENGAVKLSPGSTESKKVKDPKVKNNGDVSAYVFVGVEIPKKNVRVMTERKMQDANGEEYTAIIASDPTKTALYNLIYETTETDINGEQKTNTSQFNNTSWVLVETNDTDDKTEYIFAYAKDGEMTELSEGETTPEPVFNRVELCNLYAWQPIEILQKRYVEEFKYKEIGGKRIDQAYKDEYNALPDSDLTEEQIKRKEELDDWQSKFQNFFDYEDHVAALEIMEQNYAAGNYNVEGESEPLSKAEYRERINDIRKWLRGNKIYDVSGLITADNKFDYSKYGEYIENERADINVTAYGIQLDTGSEDPATVWNTLKNNKK